MYLGVKTGMESTVESYEDLCSLLRFLSLVLYIDIINVKNSHL